MSRKPANSSPKIPRDVARGVSEKRADADVFDRRRAHRDARRASEAADRLLRDLKDVISQRPAPRTPDAKE